MTRGSTVALRLIPNEMETLADNAQLLALFLGVLILPSVELEATIHKDRPSLLEILTDGFGGATPSGAFNECNLLFFLTIFTRPCAVDGD